jgi:hypothetical protein
MQNIRPCAVALGPSLAQPSTSNYTNDAVTISDSCLLPVLVVGLLPCHQLEVGVLHQLHALTFILSRVTQHPDGWMTMNGGSKLLYARACTHHELACMEELELFNAYNIASHDVVGSLFMQPGSTVVATTCICR